MLTRLFAVLAFCALVSPLFGADERPEVRPITIANDLLTVSIDKAGLSAVTDRATGFALRFKNEACTVEMNDYRFDTGGMRPVRIENTDRSATFTYTDGGGNRPVATMRVVYELKPGWRFVSKQIFLELAGESFTIKRIEPFRANLAGTATHTHAIDRGMGIWAGFMRFPGQRDGDPGYGAFALVQNPFCKWSCNYRTMPTLSYEPKMEWKMAWGPFASDRTCIGVYPLSGTELPMQRFSETEFIRNPEQAIAWAPKIDLAESQALRDCVRAFMMRTPKQSVRMNVGWCENDYQIDVATPEGKAEYKRIIDRAAEMGFSNILYAPANSAVSNRKDSRDAWGWEHLLWLGMGQKIRRDEWDPAKDAVPPSVQEMLDYAKGKGVGLVAYVYPTVPWMQDPEWTKWTAPNVGGYSCVDTGVRSFQDWFVRKLVDFHKKTGCSGYSFDLYYLNGGTSIYCQWFGMRRVLEELERQAPGLLLDGRQTICTWGPWTHLSGIYPHPFGWDEQPGSFTACPDLHTDRISANHMRTVNYSFRVTQFYPTELVPGYMTHQTQRGDNAGVMHHDTFRARDWDCLGWKYSALSSIATAPYFHLISVIPARDPDEFRHFPEADRQWIRKWMDWTDRNIAILKNVNPITPSPLLGRVDGTAAFDGDHGFIFLFNPNYRKTTARVALNTSIGLTAKASAYRITQLHPTEGLALGKPYGPGEVVSVELEGASAMVLEVTPLEAPGAEPQLFNSVGAAKLADGKLELSGIRGEIGGRSDLVVALPANATPSACTVNGKSAAFQQNGGTVTIPMRFAGQRFGQCQQVGAYDPDFKGGAFSGTFTIPRRVLAQLEARRKAWPIPYTEDDKLAPWLAPDRLLLFICIAEPNPRMQVAMTIDGKPVELKTAWNGIYPKGAGEGALIGWYADVSSLAPDAQHKVELQLPALLPGQFQGLYFDNVETEYTDAVEPNSRSDGAINGS